MTVVDHCSDTPQTKTPISDAFARIFVASSGLLLTASACGKMLSATGRTPVLHATDPIFSIEFRYLFLMVGTIELATALFCFLVHEVGARISAISLLAANFLGYRFGLWMLNYHEPCGCLGNLTSAIGISAREAEAIARWILAYLVFGCVVFALCRWRHLRMLAH